MASAKEIRGQIKAIQNTGKITKAMEMVAASKMRKAQERVLAARPYAEGLANVIANLMQSHPEYRHPFVVEREVKRSGVIVITSDKGLCGGLNTNALKKVVSHLNAINGEADVFTIGRRGGTFLKRFKVNMVGAVENVPDSPEIVDVLGVIGLALDKYMRGELDEVHLVYSEFVNTMTQSPKLMRLLPCPLPKKATHEGYWDYLYEPDSKEVMDGLLRRYVESLVFHGVLENKACEQSARMVAMKAATDNAKEIVKDLSITYNKARQAAITQELAEICAGAAAS
ncbi:MAG: F0F1 ATP synthase subunit gamma [Zetaproteobacteria bacterium]|nr:F0F1 ATP synthase subunit gamma [Zetaproteobacteria bacterium]